MYFVFNQSKGAEKTYDAIPAENTSENVQAELERINILAPAKKI